MFNYLFKVSSITFFIVLFFTTVDVYSRYTETDYPALTTFIFQLQQLPLMVSIAIVIGTVFLLIKMLIIKLKRK